MLKTTLEQWRMLKAVVDCGGFAQAAETLHKSQSSVHHAIQKLQHSLGVRLLEVRGRKAYLTEHGELMLRRASFLLGEAGKIESVAASLRRGVEPRLTVAVDEAFPQQPVYRALKDVSEQFPLLSVEVVETVLSGANELLADRRADVALSPFGMNEGLEEELCQVQFIAVAAPGHPLQQLHRELSLEDLKSHRQIVVRDSALGIKKDSGWLGAEQRWTVSHLRSSVDLVVQGLGYAWLPAPVIAEYLDKKILLPLRLAQHAQRSTVFYLNILDKDGLGPAALCLVAALRRQVRSAGLGHQRPAEADGADGQ